MLENSIIIAVIISLEELIKKMAGDKVVKYIPIINLILGVLAAFVYLGLEPKMAVFEGIVIGLTASGLYSGVKNVKQAVKGE